MKPSLLIGGNTHRELGDLLRAEGSLVISGAGNETAKSLLLSHLLHFNMQPTLVVADDEAQVDILRHWLSFFDQDPVTFVDIHEGEGDVILTTDTLQRFLLFMRGEGKVFLTSKKVYESAFPLYTDLQKRSMTLKTGDELPFTQFVEDLLSRGYEHALDSILAPGQYRRVGDTLDIFPIQSEHPYRIQFTFDTIEKIERADGEELRAEKEVLLVPVRFEKTATIGEQFPKGALLVIDDLDDLPAPKLGSMCRIRGLHVNIS